MVGNPYFGITSGSLVIGQESLQCPFERCRLWVLKKRTMSQA